MGSLQKTREKTAVASSYADASEDKSSFEWMGVQDFGLRNHAPANAGGSGDTKV